MILIFTFVGCKTYDGNPPRNSQYATWDGNYIYCGNLKCKTTREDEEAIFETIIYDNQEVDVEEVQDLIYINDKM